MYWLTRSVMFSHDASTTITVMKAVRGTNHMDKPSRPRWY